MEVTLTEIGISEMKFKRKVMTTLQLNSVSVELRSTGGYRFPALCNNARWSVSLDKHRHEDRMPNHVLSFPEASIEGRLWVCERRGRIENTYSALEKKPSL